jgi:hypothetical protein
MDQALEEHVGLIKKERPKDIPIKVIAGRRPAAVRDDRKIFLISGFSFHFIPLGTRSALFKGQMWTSAARGTRPAFGEQIKKVMVFLHNGDVI